VKYCGGLHHLYTSSSSADTQRGQVFEVVQVNDQAFNIPLVELRGFGWSLQYHLLVGSPALARQDALHIRPPTPLAVLKRQAPLSTTLVRDLQPVQAILSLILHTNKKSVCMFRSTESHKSKDSSERGCASRTIPAGVVEVCRPRQNSTTHALRKQ
jgi:hypothetical protein